MANFQTTKSYALLGPILLVGAMAVGAVDVTFFQSGSECNGAGYAFRDLAPRTCAIANAGSVLFTGMDNCRTSRVYRNGGCDRDPVGSGTGNRCYIGGGFTSGYWYQSCRRRSLLGDHDIEMPSSHGCELTAQPTGIVYAPRENRGSWMFETSDAFDLMPQLLSLPDEEKVAWMRSHGATFDGTLAVL